MKTQKTSNRVRFLAVAGLIAGLYTALTVALAPFSFGIVQCRVAEALTILAAYSPASIVGLTTGCFLSNLLSMGANPAGAWDLLLGPLATGLAAVLSYWLRGIRWGGLPVLSTLPPVVTNALIVGTELTFAFGPVAWWNWGLMAGSVAIGQAVACVVGGLIVAKSIENTKILPLLQGKSYTDR